MSEAKTPNTEIIDELLQLITSPSTLHHYKQYFKNLCGFLAPNFGEKFILDYSADELKKTILWIDTQHWSCCEKKKHMTALRKLIDKAQEPYLMRNEPIPTKINYGYLLDYKKILGRDFRDLPSKTITKNYLNATDWTTLIHQIKEKNQYHYVILRLFESGCRVGGLVRIKLENLNLEIGYFDSIEKTGKVRYFIPNSLIPELKWFILRTDPKCYLLGKKLQNIHENTIRQEILHKYTKINPHDLRRSMMRLFDQAGATESDLCLLSNHKPNMNALYAKINPFTEPAIAKMRYQALWDKVFLTSI
jgi:integrase